LNYLKIKVFVITEINVKKIPVETVQQNCLIMMENFREFGF